MMNLTDIETLTKDYAASRKHLADLAGNLQEKIDRCKEEALPLIRVSASKSADLHAALEAIIESNKHLFEKPRTHVFHGVKVGTRKQPGKVLCSDPERSATLIKTHYPDLIPTTTKVKTSLLKAGFTSWTAQMLKKCGITIEADSDAVVIKSIDEDIDKLIAALLADKQTQGGAV